MLDRDLAVIYQTQPRILNQAVKRNLRRFPADFMFQLTKEEVEVCSRSQFVILNDRGQNIKYLPYLKTDIAIEVSIMIMRIFVELRREAISQPSLTIFKVGALLCRGLMMDLERITIINLRPQLVRCQIGYGIKTP